MAKTHAAVNTGGSLIAKIAAPCRLTISYSRAKLVDDKLSESIAH